MRGAAKGLDGGLTDYGDQEFARFLRRSFARSTGLTSQSLDRPVVGICHTASGFNPCHRHFDDMVEAVSRGVTAAGGLPVPFPVMSLGEAFLNPTSMVYRNLMAMAVEEMIRAQPMDSVVLLGGCDKTVPALLMGAASAGKPAALMVAGPMMTGRHRGDRLGACTDCRRFWALFRAGRIEREEIEQVEGRLAVTTGTCAVMGTASSMALVAETLGFVLPGTAAIPAVHADRLRAAEETGALAVTMATEGGPTPCTLITPQSVDNAFQVLLAVSGSTNAVIHLAAIAGRAGIDFDPGRFNELARTTPVIVDLKPVGEGYMEDFHAAGGLDGVLREIAGRLEGRCIDITGGTLAQRLENPLADPVDHRVIRKADDPVDHQGGLVVLRGSLAPDGALLKRAAATPRLLESEGRAVVFSSLEYLATRIDSPDLDVREDDVLVLKNAGPASPAGMPEAGYLPVPRKLAAKGVTDMVRISDARMSGTAYGTIVLHVAPESHLGGPLALVEDGDRIRLSVSSGTIDLLVSDDELERRRRAWQKSDIVHQRGYRSLHSKSVLPWTKGCDLDFLRPAMADD